MPIDFHAEQNRKSYSHRAIDDAWKTAMSDIIRLERFEGQRIADIGCGGGLYAKAWAQMGATVTAVDFSGVMLQAARETCRGMDNVTVLPGNALDSGLASCSFDIVFERALLHHVSDWNACMREAERLLAFGGNVIFQDRTPEDIMIAGSSEHLRGYFFECFPRLREVEFGRRPRQEDIVRGLREAGFRRVETKQLWEVRRVYGALSELAEDMRSRAGRSILHELDDDELEILIEYIGRQVPNDSPIVEKDRWTIWTGSKQSVC